MSRRQATLEVDEELLSALQRAAADDGVAPGELLDEALRRYFGLRGLAVGCLGRERAGHALLGGDPEQLVEDLPDLRLGVGALEQRHR
ncbi:MAG: hypothetical protein MUP97_17775, partial [Acidimicrobiia bacterium]|nr:hypothetical protein [Acidimicrobiia bacterium]